MKNILFKILIAGLFLLFEFPLFAESKISLNKTMITSCNLRLRSTEETTSSVITTMQEGTLVKIVKLGKQQTIDNITSQWVRVEVLDNAKDKDGKALKKDTVGWCFGGYLEDDIKYDFKKIYEREFSDGENKKCELIALYNLDGKIVQDGYEFYQYDSKGNLIYKKDKYDRDCSWYKYDEKGNVVYEKYKSKNDSYETKYEYEYDSKGNLISAKSSEGSIIEYDYDSKGRLIAMWQGGDGPGFIIHYEYDSVGNLICKKEFSGEFGESHYEYDSNGNMISKKYNNFEPELYSYDFYNNGKPRAKFRYEAK